MEWNKATIELKREINKINLKKMLIPDNIDEYIASLELIFKKHGYKNYRLMAYYLILNTCNSSQLLEDYNFGSFINEESAVPVCVVSKFLSNPDYFPYLCEAVHYGFACASIPVANDFVNSIKNTDISNFHSLINIIKAIIQKINNFDGKRTPLSLWDCLENAIRAIISDFNGSSTEIGVKFYNYLDLLCNSLEGEYLHENLSTHCFYKFTKEMYYDNLVEKNIQDIRKTLFKPLAAFLNFLTCDIWMAWSDTTFSNSPKTIQMEIGNKINGLLIKIYENECIVDPQVIQCLKHMDIKPLSTEDIIKESSILEIMETIKIGEASDMNEWYNALNRANETSFCKDQTKILLQNIVFAEEPDKVLIGLADHLTKINDASLNSLLLETIEKLPVPIQINVLFVVHKLQFLRNENCQSDMIEKFNKICASSDCDTMLKEMIVLLMQDSRTVIYEVFQMSIASVANQELCEKLLLKVKPILLDPWQNSNTLISTVMEMNLENNLSEKESQIFLLFLRRLVESSIICWNDLLEVVFNHLERNIVAINWFKCLIGIKIMNLIVDSETSDIRDEAVLIFFAHVISKTSWSWNSFDAIKCRLHEIAVETVVALLKKEAISDEGKMIVKECIANHSISTKSVFSDYWTDSEIAQEIKLYTKLFWMLRSVNRCQRNNFLLEKDRAQIVAAIILILPMLLSKEWIRLHQILRDLMKGEDESESDEAAFMVISDAMTALALCVGSTSMPCFEFCINNYSHLFLDIVNHANILTLHLIIRYFRYFLKPIKRLSNAECKERCFLAIMPHIVKLSSQFLICNSNLELSELQSVFKALPLHWQDECISAIRKNIEKSKINIEAPSAYPQLSV